MKFIKTDITIHKIYWIYVLGGTNTTISSLFIFALMMIIIRELQTFSVTAMYNNNYFKNAILHLDNDTNVCLTVCPYIHPSIYLSVHPSIYPSIHPSIHLSIHRSMYLFQARRKKVNIGRGGGTDISFKIFKTKFSSLLIIFIMTTGCKYETS